MRVYHYTKDFPLESGGSLPEVTIAYHTYGELNKKKDNVVWVFHALTANSDAESWWPGVIGKGAAIDSEKYFIVCANILGSCYGSSGPLSINPSTGSSYFSSFPAVTIRDMVNAHKLLADELGIKKIKLGIAGSMGGYQALEWAVNQPQRFDNLCLLATNARESAWAIAVHSAQRLALKADQTFTDPDVNAGRAGLKAARAIGMLTYRTYDAFVNTQSDTDDKKLSDFRAASYIDHQGEKLVKRFNAYSYYLLTRAMDSHNIGRGRGGVRKALEKIKSKTLVLGLSTDQLCPVIQQKDIVKGIPGAVYGQIDSNYGHDGFLIEAETIGVFLKKFFKA
jgi:homoserine O-acetyltransferase/O-succinyltransferase